MLKLYSDCAGASTLRQTVRVNGPRPDMIRRYCNLTPVHAELLQSPEAPIVLIPADGPEKLPDGIAPGLNSVGFMLPYTPLHLLITRANRSTAW